VEPTQLSPFDASFLALDGPVSVGHVNLLMLLDGDVTLPELRQQVAARLHLVPILRRRLKAPTFVVGRPWWVDDPEFDLTRHLTSVDLGGGGRDEHVLAEGVRYAGIHLDRDRPLWGLHLIRGIEGGRSAIVTKIHHCAIDGVGKRDLLALLFATDTPAEPLRAWAADPGPDQLTRVTSRVTEAGGKVGSLLRLEARALGAAPAALLRLTRDTATRVADTLERFVEHPEQTPELPDAQILGSAPPTPFNASITSARAWAYTDLPIAPSKPVRRRTGTTVNDILMAATAGGLRQWLIEHDALTDDPLISLVPMAMTGPSRRAGSNAFTLGLCPIPTHLPTPAERLAFAHDAMNHAKSEPTYPTALIDDVSMLTGPTVTQLFTQAAARLRLADMVRLPFNLMISNVPAPAARFQVGGGANIVGTYPFPPLSDGLGLMVCTQGYAGALGVGVGSCPDLLPDPDHLRDLIVAEHDALVALG